MAFSNDSASFSINNSLWRTLFYGTLEDCKNKLNNRKNNSLTIETLKDSQINNTHYEFDSEPLNNSMIYINEYTNSLLALPSILDLESHIERYENDKQNRAQKCIYCDDYNHEYNHEYNDEDMNITYTYDYDVNSFYESDYSNEDFSDTGSHSDG